MDNVKLSDGEWKLMNVLWECAPCSLAELVKALEEDTGWTKSTVFVMLKRLIAKNAVSVDHSGKIQTYSPTVEKSEMAGQEADSFLERVYEGSIGLMVSGLTERHSLSQEDIEKLRSILDEAESSLRGG